MSLTDLRERLAEWIRPKKRVSVDENWQESAEDRLGSDFEFDHYAQYVVRVDGESCGIGFDVYVSDSDYGPEPYINVWDMTEQHREYDSDRHPDNVATVQTERGTVRMKESDVDVLFGDE